MNRLVFALGFGVSALAAGGSALGGSALGGYGLAGLRGQVPGIPTGPKPYASPWHKATQPPLVMAKLVDAQLGAAKQLMGGYKAILQMRGRGTSIGDIQVKDSKTFHLEYPFMQHPGVHGTPIARVLVRANGSIARQYGGPSADGPVPVDKLRLLTAKSVQDWVFGGPKFVVASLHREHALTNLIEMASRPDSGFTLTSESREVYAGGRTTPETRFLFERKPGPAKTLGTAKIEILVNSQWRVPLRVDTEMMEPGRPQVDMSCLFSWQSSSTPFPDSAFTIVK